jgi:hypothetical protein
MVQQAQLVVAVTGARVLLKACLSGSNGSFGPRSSVDL